MIKKINSYTILFIGFCINFCLLIFFPDTNNIISLMIRLVCLFGLLWIVYFYFKYLSVIDNNYSKQDIQNRKLNNTQKLINSAQSQFSDLIHIIFKTIKGLNNDFEVGFYLFNEFENNYKLNKSTKDYFVDCFSTENIILNDLIKLKESKVLYQKDISDEWSNFFNDDSIRGSECIIFQNLLFNDDTAGFIIIRSQHFSEINKKDKIIVKYISEILALFIKDLDILDRTINQEDNKSQIFNLLTEIKLNYSEAEILNKFRNLLNYLMDYDILTISMIDGSNKVAKIKLVDGIKKDLPNKDQFNINGTINGLPYIKNSLINSSKSNYDLYRYSSKGESNYEYNNFLGLPIFIDEKLWGAILIERFSNKPYNTSDEILLSLVVRSIQSSMLWHYEYQNIYEDAIKDGLTGLLNHKTFVDRANEEIERAKRFQHRLVFLMYDLDKFKRVNDTLGHVYGDYVIKTTAQIIKDNVRTIDLVARYGGEEFAVILINTNTDAAMTVAQRIVDNISQHDFLMDEEHINMTISAGLSEYPNDSDKFLDLIQYADEGLYKTKDKGGNGVTIYTTG